MQRLTCVFCSSTVDEALVYFLKHEELLAGKGGGMIRNKLRVVLLLWRALR